LEFFILAVNSSASTPVSLITKNKFGSAVCGMEKLFLERPAVGDLEEK